MQSMADLENQLDMIEKNNAKNDYDLVLGKGRSMVILASRRKRMKNEKNTMCMHRKKHGCTRDIIAMRKLKAGRIRHNKSMFLG